MDSTTDYQRRLSGGTNQAPFQAPQGDPSNALEEFINRLKVVADQTAKHRDRLERIIARAFGEGAEVAGKSDKPQPAGSIGAIMALLERIGHDLDGVDHAITRLDQLA